MSFRSKPIGWRYESARHSLAARGLTSRYSAVKKLIGPEKVSIPSTNEGVLARRKFWEDRLEFAMHRLNEVPTAQERLHWQSQVDEATSRLKVLDEKVKLRQLLEGTFVPQQRDVFYAKKYKESPAARVRRERLEREAESKELFSDWEGNSKRAEEEWLKEKEVWKKRPKRFLAVKDPFLQRQETQSFLNEIVSEPRMEQIYAEHYKGLNEQERMMLSAVFEDVVNTRDEMKSIGANYAKPSKFDYLKAKVYAADIVKPIKVIHEDYDER
jgi:hypothetical protein